MKTFIEDIGVVEMKQYLNGPMVWNSSRSQTVFENKLTHWIFYRRKVAKNSMVNSYGVVNLKVHCFFVKIPTAMDVWSVFSCTFPGCSWWIFSIIPIILLSNHVMNFFIVRKLVGLVQTMYDYANAVAAIVRKCFNERSLSEYKFYACIVGMKWKITLSELN